MVIRRVFEHGAYADRAFAAEAQAASLAPRDRALAMQLCYGVVQRRATLDHLAERLSDRPVSKFDPPVLAALRLGLFQLLFLDRVAPHAAVNDSVELAKRSGSGGSPLVNAVLRRASSEGRKLLGGLEDSTPTQAALRHSVPEWLAEQWWRELGPDEARSLLAAVNQPAESALRVNTLRSTPEQVLARLPVPVRPAPGLPEGLVIEAPFDIQSSELWHEGAVMAQSRGSMLVSRVLAPRPGDRVLDLCSAPGAKTTHLAALMAGEGEIVAVERHPGRAKALSRTCVRMHAGCVRVEIGDAVQPRAGPRFDRVLVDPPCSGLGTLQSRPDIRWRANPAAIAGLARLQGQILEAAATVTAPGGLLVYSVCTVSRAESEDVVARFLDAHDEFADEDLDAEYPDRAGPLDRPVPPDRAGPPDTPGRGHIQLLPHRDGTDGFFIARLRRRAAS